MDQSQRAAPHGLSQLATSFLACLRLGIPRAPLLRLASVQGNSPEVNSILNHRLTSYAQTLHLVIFLALDCNRTTLPDKKDRAALLARSSSFALRPRTLS